MTHSNTQIKPADELSPEILQLIEEEESELRKVAEILQNELAAKERRLATESKRARELTSQIVAATRDEDKHALASDEAVSHGLARSSFEDIETIQEALRSPYFGRIVVEETNPSGRKVLIEYKIGLRSNVDARIIDWRRAPISKLFYEYREGEEYFEIIQDRDREGKVLLRHKVEIKEGELIKISCRHGDFAKENGRWKVLTGKFRSGGAQAGQLPDVFSLITPEQFRAITVDAHSAVLIQGVAGSGKTTVALYRLSWLLHEGNSAATPEQCLVVVRSNALARYIERSLIALRLPKVKILTFADWARRELKLESALLQESDEGDVGHPLVAPGVLRVKNSLAFLSLVEERIAELGTTITIERGKQIIIETLSNAGRILDRDESKLMDRELVRASLDATASAFSEGILSVADGALIVRMQQLATQYATPTTGQKAQYEYVIADEVQDFSVTQLAAISGLVPAIERLTLVGDTAQEIGISQSFLGWDRLRSYWKLDESRARFVSLMVSHRSTLPIMRLADHVNGQTRTETGRPGKAPLWYRCADENLGVEEAIGWLKRASEKYVGGLLAVICRTQREARHVVGLLDPTFGSAVRLGDDQSFSFEEGILVTDVLAVKGLEFQHVLIWNPTEHGYPATSRARNLLYVAITRAEELLTIVSWGSGSPILPSIKSPLVRGREIVREVEEKEEKIDWLG